MHDQHGSKCQPGITQTYNDEWNVKRILVKIVLSYTTHLNLAEKMKRQLDVHEVMALAILAGAFAHGILLAKFTL